MTTTENNSSKHDELEIEKPRVRNLSYSRQALLYLNPKLLKVYMVLAIIAALVFAAWDYATVSSLLHSGSLDSQGNETLSASEMTARSLLTIGMAMIFDLLVAQGGWKKFLAIIPVAIVLVILYVPVSQLHSADIASVFNPTASSINQQAAVQQNANGSTLMDSTTILTPIATLLYCLLYMVPMALFALSCGFIWKIWQQIRLSNIAKQFIQDDADVENLRVELNSLKQLVDDLEVNLTNSTKASTLNGLNACKSEVESRAARIDRELNSTSMSGQDRAALEKERDRVKDVLRSLTVIAV
jgi:hypothetical protein